MSAVQTYQEAFRTHEEAKNAVKAKVKVVEAISSAMQWHLRSFLGFNFNIQIDKARERFDPKGRVNVDEWPSAEELKQLFNDWNRADTALRQAWAAIDHQDRAGLAPPPADMRL